MRLCCCFRKLRKRHFLILLVVLTNCASFYIMHKLITADYEDVPGQKLKYVVVHIDLKGAPPKIPFLKSMMYEVKKLGANALLMEYEDMFPYINDLVNLSRPDHYTDDELKDFLTEAKLLDLEIIPLIQTFGHMEFVLKLKQFAHLRENKSYADSICPSRLGSEVLISSMLQQMIKFHANIAPLKHIHVGCDEVNRINVCEYCVKRKLHNHELFLDHVSKITKHVTSLSPNTTVLIWADMLKTLFPKDWVLFKPIPNLEPVYWWYNSDMEMVHVPLFFYHLHFQNMWVASAFKGADGRDAATPNYKNRLSNTVAWLKVVVDYYFSGEKEAYQFKGLILTGWSRYTHFAPLCELLPVSYISLVSALVFISKTQNDTLPEKVDIDANNWDDSDLIIFNQHFYDDYYRLVGCEKGDCIFNSTILLYDAVKRYVDFLETVGFDLKHVDVKKEHKSGWCFVMQNMLNVFEDDVRLNMMPFYTSEVSKEYLMKSSGVRKKIDDCLGLGKTKRTLNHSVGYPEQHKTRLLRKKKKILKKEVF